jgi:hypothetical protein
VGSNPTARTFNQGDMMEESENNDIVELLRMRACPSEGEYLESDHGHSDCYLEREAADEIERLRFLISEWADASDKWDGHAETDARERAAVTALRKVVGR